MRRYSDGESSSVHLMRSQSGTCRENNAVERTMRWRWNTVKTPEHFEIEVKCFLRRADSKATAQCVPMFCSQRVREIFDVGKVSLVGNGVAVPLRKTLQRAPQSKAEFLAFARTGRRIIEFALWAVPAS